MQKKITTFLMFNDRAEDAVRLYTSAFPNSKVLSESREEKEGRSRKGKFVSATFTLAGQEFMAMNGGPVFHFDEGMSLFVTCRDQKEVDRLWEKLSKGGEKGRCGWLKDRFGVSWQIIPEEFAEMMSDPESGDVGRMIAAMMTMGKLDVKALRDAYRGA
jgi:predicted 3-demethylubiquinone-9 3-methyltransferase (glyoxalase superfamily)